MKLYQIVKQAKEMDVDPAHAIRMRQRYLAQQLSQGIAWILEETEMPQVMPMDALGELLALSERPKVQTHHSTSITDEMVAQARAVRVDTVLEFSRGKAMAWCHDDHRPSLTFMTKLGIAWCPACHKYFDAIAIQQHLTGQSFPEAVRSLCS